MNPRTLVILLLSVSAFYSAAADTLVLSGNDRLSGTLVNIDRGTLSFRTKLAGKVFVPVDEVAGLRTEGIVVVRVGSKELAPGRFDYSGGDIFLTSRQGQSRQTIDLSEVTRVTRIAEAQANGSGESAAGVAPLSMRGAVDSGYVHRGGTREYQGAGARLELSGKNDESDFAAHAGFEYVGDDPSFKRFFDAEARASHSLSDVWVPQLILEFERNRNKALQLRSDVTMVMGRRILESEAQQLEGFAGVGVAIERFDAEPLRRDQNLAPTGEPRIAQEELNLNVGLGYSLVIFRDLTVAERLLARPSLSNPGDLRAELESAVTLPISSNLTMRLDLLLDFEDDTKYRDIESLNTRFGASLRLDF